MNDTPTGKKNNETFLLIRQGYGSKQRREKKKRTKLIIETEH